MQLNSNLVEEAKLLAQQKAESQNVTASQIRQRQEEAKNIRDQDDMIFGSGLESPSALQDREEIKKSVRNDFMQNSAMLCSVVDMQRDPSFTLATNQAEIHVQNKKPG